MADMTFKANLLPYDSTKELGKSNDNSKWWKLYSSGISSNGHINLTGSHASSSTANTSQIIFGTYASDYSTEHVALSSNNKALVINPNHGQTTNQIVLYLDKASVFPKGINGNASTATRLQTARNIQTNLESTSAASFNGSSDITPGISGTLSVNHGGTGQTNLSYNAILLGNNTDGIQASSLTISGTTIDSASDLEIDSNDILNLYGLNEAHLFTDNNNIDLTSSGITIHDDATINISTPQGGNNLINLTSTVFNINAALTKLPGNYYFGYDSFYRQGEIIIESQGTGDTMLALKAGDSGSSSYVDISDQSSGIVISTIDSRCDITIQSYDKININGKMILTEDINYGTALPSTGTTGQIFFKYVT